MTLLYVCFISDFIWSINCLLTRSLLPLATKLRQGNVFTPVCDCIHGEVSVRVTPWTETPVWTETPLDRAPPGQRPPFWTETRLWTETPGQRTPSEQRCPLDREPPLDRDPPCTEMPPRQRTPSGQRPSWTEMPSRTETPWTEMPLRTETSLPGQRPPDQRPHPSTETPPDRDPAAPYGKERAVRILLECILVSYPCAVK